MKAVPREPHAEPRTGWPDWWVVALLLLAAFVVLGHLWVFHGPNREWALGWYKIGRFRAVIAAGLLGLCGIGWGLLRPPFVHPWRLVGLATVLFIVFAAPVPYGFPSSHRDQPSSVVLGMPVTGSWRVLSGGGTAHNPLSLEPDRCHGLLLAREVEGARWRVPGEDHVDSNLSWSVGCEVFAPAQGQVVAAVGDQADRSFQLRVEHATGRGNHVVLRIEDGAYLVLAHLQEGSLKVQVGDQVVQGQPLGKLGSSGRGIPLTQPHLDLHLATLPGEGEGEGIPFFLGGYRLAGREVERGSPKGGLGLGDAVKGDLLESDLNSGARQ